jgi:hypothetical protein
MRSLGVYFGALGPAGAGMRRVLPGGRPGDSPISPVLAGSSGGDALLAWNHGDRVAVDRQDPGGPLRPPIVAGRFSLADAAIDPKGNATIVGARNGAAISVATAPRAGRFGKLVSLPGQGTFARVAAGPNGQTAVVGPTGDRGLELFYRPLPGGDFGAPETLAASGVQTVVGIAVDAQGRVFVAWTQLDPDRQLRLWTMTTDASGHPTQPFVLSSAGRDVPYSRASADMNADGDAAAVWEEATPPAAAGDRPKPPVIQAAFASAGGGFSPAQQVTSPGRHAAAIAPPTVAVGDDAAATLLWADAADAADPGDADQRFATARLTSAGMSAAEELDSAAPLPGVKPSTPPLVIAHLAAKGQQRVNAATGRFKLRVRCTSWTLDACKGRLRVAARGPNMRLAQTSTFALPPNATRRITVRVNRAGRRILASGRAINAIVRVLLSGPNSKSTEQRLILKAR